MPLALTPHMVLEMKLATFRTNWVFVSFWYRNLCHWYWVLIWFWSITGPLPGETGFFIRSRCRNLVLSPTGTGSSYGLGVIAGPLPGETGSSYSLWHENLVIFRYWGSIFKWFWNKKWAFPWFISNSSISSNLERQNYHVVQLCYYST